MRRTEQANVTTWADGFGIWHARVTYDRNPEAAAQVAIWREIEARQGQPAPVPHVVQDNDDPQVWHEVDPEAEKPRLAALMAEASVWANTDRDPSHPSFEIRPLRDDVSYTGAVRTETGVSS